MLVVDLWSLGVILVYVVFGEVFFWLFEGFCKNCNEMYVDSFVVVNIVLLLLLWICCC